MNLLLPLTSLLLVAYLGTTVSGADDWAYTGEHGSRNWCSLGNNSCCGKHQSPINLPYRTRYDRVEPFNFKDYYRAPKSMEIINNGHTVEVTIEDDDLQPRISGGGLDGEYIFEQFHFHWGGSVSWRGVSPGSEHTFAGERYPMELHLVHYNSKFKSITEALESGEKDALAVLGVLYHNDYRGSSALDIIARHLPDIRYKDDKTELTPFPLIKLLPDTSTFYRYSGSLTTPTCDEVVDWTVFTSTKPGSTEQLFAFTKVYTTEEDEPQEKMINNFRPLQDINRRQIWKLHAYSYY